MDAPLTLTLNSTLAPLLLQATRTYLFSIYSFSIGCSSILAIVLVFIPNLVFDSSVESRPALSYLNVTNLLASQNIDLVPYPDYQ